MDVIFILQMRRTEPGKANCDVPKAQGGLRIIPPLHCLSSLLLLKSQLDGPQESRSATPTHLFPPILKDELTCSPTRDVPFNYVSMKADVGMKKTDLPPLVTDSVHVPREYFQSTYFKAYKLWS